MVGRSLQVALSRHHKPPLQHQSLAWERHLLQKVYSTRRSWRSACAGNLGARYHHPTLRTETDHRSAITVPLLAVGIVHIHKRGQALPALLREIACLSAIHNNCCARLRRGGGGPRHRLVPTRDHIKLQLEMSKAIMTSYLILNLYKLTVNISVASPHMYRRPTLYWQEAT